MKKKIGMKRKRFNDLGDDAGTAGRSREEVKL